eukprot:15485717-Alexandrium_andersonii.AAC.1
MSSIRARNRRKSATLQLQLWAPGAPREASGSPTSVDSERGTKDLSPCGPAGGRSIFHVAGGLLFSDMS